MARDWASETECIHMLQLAAYLAPENGAAAKRACLSSLVARLCNPC